MEPKEKIAAQIVNLILENDLTFVDLEYELPNKELFADTLKNFDIVESESRKEGSDCIVTTVCYFEDYDLYIKEEQIGQCHYRDVAIDGLPDEINHYICKQIKVISYSEVSKI